MIHNMQYPSPDLIRGVFTNKQNELRHQIKDAAFRLYKKLLQEELSIAFAESVTGGLLMSEFVNVKGVSDVFKGGIVCYQSNVKKQHLNVDPDLINEHTSESTRISTAIAEGIKEKIPCDISIGITGLASIGASASKSKPIGSIFLSIIYNGKIFQTSTVINGNRWDIRHQACLFTFNQVYDLIANPKFFNLKHDPNTGITNRGRLIINF